MKLFLVHTMLFVGSICKNKSGWFLFVMSLGLLWWSQKFCCWQLGWIFNPTFAEDQALMTPKSQWNSSLSIQCCLLGPYARIKVVDSCLICPWGCWWSQKFCWQLGSMTLIFNPTFAEDQALNVQRSLVSYDYLIAGQNLSFPTEIRAAAPCCAALPIQMVQHKVTHPHVHGGRLPSIPGLSGVTKFITSGRLGGDPPSPALCSQLLT
jgi:hypothetical protein